MEERVREELGMGEVENERDGVMEESAWQRKKQLFNYNYNFLVRERLLKKGHIIVNRIFLDVFFYRIDTHTHTHTYIYIYLSVQKSLPYNHQFAYKHLFFYKHENKTLLNTVIKKN